LVKVRGSGWLPGPAGQKPGVDHWPLSALADLQENQEDER
jgi:hypothetical protein